MEIIREPKFRLSPTKVPTQITVKIPLIYTITVVIFRLVRLHLTGWNEYALNKRISENRLGL